MLAIENLICGYGAFQAVHDISFEVLPGTITCLLGPNGAGKSSTIMCIAGHVQRQHGRIMFEGADVSALSPRERVRKGIAISPEGRRLFKNLTVRENLKVGGLVHPTSWFAQDFEEIMTLFPRLGERLDVSAENLSGGEQQMLAIARALMTRPKLIMIDELSLGLMPKIIDICYEALLKLKTKGMTILLVEQNTERALEVSEQVCVLKSGRLVWSGTAKTARSDPYLTSTFLGLH